jgi:hypothetical protein
MVLRLALALGIASTFAHACDCVYTSAREMRHASEIVFRGKVVGFRDSKFKGARDAVFDVDRVWKGSVARSFEMPAVSGTCFGFFRPPRIGDEYVIFAKKDKAEYSLPVGCSGAWPSDRPEIQKLGPGRKPKAN